MTRMHPSSTDNPRGSSLTIPLGIRNRTSTQSLRSQVPTPPPKGPVTLRAVTKFLIAISRLAGPSQLSTNEDRPISDDGGSTLAPGDDQNGEEVAQDSPGSDGESDDYSSTSGSDFEADVVNYQRQEEEAAKELELTNFEQKTCDEAPEFCNEEEPEIFWCSLCKLSLCGTCWSKQTAHRKNRAGHDKISQQTLHMLQSIMNPTKGKSQDHLAAYDSKWFGVNIDQEKSDITLDITTRYRKLAMMNASFGQTSQFPALISFVGETGAGKSSLVNALIKVSRPGGPLDFSIRASQPQFA